ncbi:MAG: hypothetical protein ACPGJE_04735, partial [Wenzhouxiangellaceae bacterium]
QSDKAETGQINEYTFEFELSASGLTEGPLLVRVLDSMPVRITTPRGHSVSLTLDEFVNQDRVLTRIRSEVILDGESESIVLPQMMVSGLGEVSLSPRDRQGETGLERLGITLASVELISADEIQKSSDREPCEDETYASDAESFSDVWIHDGEVRSSCCNLNCSDGSDSGPWSCCGDAATCCCNEAGGCCSPQEKDGL